MKSGASGKALDGLSILVVEDESLISRLIEDTLKDLGCPEIWNAANVDAALTLLAKRRPDIAVVDVNLTGRLAYPVAVRLDDMRVPVVFLTAYARSQLPAFWRSRPLVNKPFKPETLAAALAAALHDPRAA